MYNHIVLIGRLGRNPETRTTTGGRNVATFSMATDRTWKDRDSGEKRSETSWHNVVCWGGLADVVAKYLQKGKLVMIAGRVHTRSWDDADTGQKRYMTEVIAQDMKMLGGGRGDGSTQSSTETGPTDDDIPF